MKVYSALEKANFESLATDPSNPVTGSFYFNTTANKFKYWNGSAWKDLEGDISTVAGNLTAHSSTTSGIHGVTGEIVGTTDAQTLSSKTLSGSTVSNYQDYTEQASTPSNPGAGKTRFYVKNDGKGYIKSAAGTENTLASENYVQAVGVGIPSGTIVAYAGSSAPVGWLFCNGASLATASYPSLFAAIGYTHGGSGASFNLPNTQGMFLRGAGSQTVGSVSYSSPALGGKQNDTTKKNGLAVNQFSHTHSHSAISTGGSGGATTVANWTVGGAVAARNTTFGVTGDTTITVTPTLSSGDTETAPVHMSMNYIIKT